MKTFDIGKMGKKQPFSSQVGEKPKSTKQKVNEHEKELANKLGGKRQLNSGANKRHKGDIKLPEFLLDSKETGTNSIILTSTELMKIIREARGEKLIPGLVVTIHKMPNGMDTEWALIPLEIFAELIKGEEKC